MVIATGPEDNVSDKNQNSEPAYRMRNNASRIRKLAVVKIKVSRKKAAALLPTPAS